MNLKIAFRNIVRNKVYALISIIGLGVGISACLLISLNVFHEFSFDQFHAKKDRIYRVSSKLDFNGEVNAALSSLAVGPTLQKDYPEVESFCRFRSMGTPSIKYDGQIFNEISVSQTDSTLFQIFDRGLIKGDVSNVLSSPSSIVISSDLAETIFGNDDPMNKVLTIGSLTLTVSGIMENPPNNSELQADAYVRLHPSIMQGWEAFKADWFRISFYTYILFNRQIDETAFEKKMVEFEKKYVQPWIQGAGIEASILYDLTSLESLHLDNSKDYDTPKANPTYLIIFSLLAIFILLIASINFINLTLAQSSKRAKEVGVRKTLGVNKSQLITQFLSQSLIITILSLILGLALVEVLLEPFNVLTGKAFEIADIFSPLVVATMLGLVVLVGFGAGSYPAIVMSNYEPQKVLKGNVPSSGGVGALRKFLIFVQFAFSLFMIIGTMLIQDQMDFLANMDIGFDKQNVVTLTMPNDQDVIKNSETFVAELRKLEGVEKVARGVIPSGQTGQLMFRIDQEGVMKERTLKFVPVEEDFIDLMGIELLKGRNFSKDIVTDQNQAFIINEKAAEAFGWGKDALGKRMQWGLEANDSAENDGVVVGVISDFNFNSLHSPLDPLVLIYQPEWIQSQISLRISNGMLKQGLANVENKYNEFANGHAFNYRFFDESLARNYTEEERMQNVFKYFSIVSILLALLGLFALVSFAVENKTKELGVRKILGANIAQLTWLVVRDFALAVLIAFVVVSPINYYFMQEWLNDFAYKTDVGLISFIIALFSSLLLALLTVVYHVIKISRSNPVDSLRYE